MTRRHGFLVPLACAAALAAGCADRPVTVGVVAPLSGQWSLSGRPIANGIELAHQQLTADPSFPRRIALEVRDSASDPDQAADLLRELYRDGAVVAIGGVTTAEARAMIPVLDAEGKVLISPSATGPGLTGVSSLFFRIAPSGFREGARMGNFVVQELNVGRVAILAVESPDGEGIDDVFRSEFERYGGEVVAAVEYSAGAPDLRDHVARALAGDPEAIYLTGHALDVGRILARVEEQGFPGRILTTSDFAAPGAFHQVGAPAEGVLLTSPVFEPDGDPAVRRFVDAYRAKYGTPPDSLAAHGYDAMMVVAAALRQAEAVSARDVYKALRNLRGFVGAAGPVQFDDKGDVGKFPRVYMIRDGALVDYETVTDRRHEILQQLEDVRRRQLEAARRAAAGAGDG